MFGFKNPFSGGPALAAACGSDRESGEKNNEDNLYFKGFRMPEGQKGRKTICQATITGQRSS